MFFMPVFFQKIIQELFAMLPPKLFSRSLQQACDKAFFRKLKENTIRYNVKGALIINLAFLC